MSKLRAQVVGLAGCEETRYPGEVACNATRPVKVGALAATSATIFFDAKNERVSSIVATFDPNKAMELFKEMVDAFGQDTPVSPGRSCITTNWDRRDDYLVTLTACIKLSRYVKTKSLEIRIIFISNRKVKLENEERAKRRASQASARRAQSYNSK